MQRWSWVKLNGHWYEYVGYYVSNLILILPSKFSGLKLTSVIHFDVLTAKIAINDSIAATTRNIDDKMQMK